jgi:hypothetical protein
MVTTVVDVERLGLKPKRRLLSPPWLDEPLYQCATAVTVWGFLAHATVDIEVDGTVLVRTRVGFPEPVGATVLQPAGLREGAPITLGWAGQPAPDRQDTTVRFVAPEGFEPDPGR